MTSNRGCIDYGWINFYLFFFLIMNVFVYVVITWRPCFGVVHDACLYPSSFCSEVWNASFPIERPQHRNAHLHPPSSNPVVQLTINFRLIVLSQSKSSPPVDDQENKQLQDWFVPLLEIIRTIVYRSSVVSTINVPCLFNFRPTGKALFSYSDCTKIKAMVGHRWAVLRGGWQMTCV